MHGENELSIECLSDLEPRGTDTTIRSKSESPAALVERLERWRKSNPDRPAYLIEICSSLDFSERTLREACHEVLGTTRRAISDCAV